MTEATKDRLYFAAFYVLLLLWGALGLLLFAAPLLGLGA
jgi:hypothetical protein